MDKKFHFKDRLRSFKHASRGVYSFISSEHNARIHCAAIIVVTIAGFYFDITAEEWIAVILCFGLVLAAEAFNTAIERMVDLVSPEYNPLAGNIKDIAAAAVLICAIAATLIGIIIFIPYIVSI